MNDRAVVQTSGKQRLDNTSESNQQQSTYIPTTSEPCPALLNIVFPVSADECALAASRMDPTLSNVINFSSQTPITSITCELVRVFIPHMLRDLGTVRLALLSMKIRAKRMLRGGYLLRSVLRCDLPFNRESAVCRISASSSLALSKANPREQCLEARACPSRFPRLIGPDRSLLHPSGQLRMKSHFPPRNFCNLEPFFLPASRRYDQVVFAQCCLYKPRRRPRNDAYLPHAAPLLRSADSRFILNQKDPHLLSESNRQFATRRCSLNRLIGIRSALDHTRFCLVLTVLSKRVPTELN